MYGIFRIDSDGCTYSAETLLFVTDTEQKAKDFVALAELEIEEVLKLKCPVHSTKDIQTLGAQRLLETKKEYSEQVNALITVDLSMKQDVHYFAPEKREYFYEKVVVR